MEHFSFMDSNGVTWSVREDGAEDSRSLSGDVAPGTTWLRFDSELEVRRLWHYPDDWRGLSPIQLENLLDRASTVIARFRSAGHRPMNADPSSGRPIARPAELRPQPARPESGPPRRPANNDPER